MKQVLTLLAIFAAAVSGSVVKLEVDTFDKLTAGKTVFIKFFAPWVCTILKHRKYHSEACDLSHIG
jgi:hypothetical protein